MSAQSFIVPDSPETTTYNSYLKIKDLLSLQAPLSNPNEHDETLFIIIHQSYELWFKQILHEIDFAIQSLQEKNVMACLKTLKRVATIQTHLVHQVAILETMTPIDFNRFRNLINPASGFQSHQFRLLEFSLGMKDKNLLKFFHHEPFALQKLTQALKAKPLYDYFLSYLHHRGFNIPQSILNRDIEEAYPKEGFSEVESVMDQIYAAANTYYDLYMILEALIDIDEQLLLWRFRHVAMVERMIGNRHGTGGSPGVKYLSSTLSKRCFPEIWNIRSKL